MTDEKDIQAAVDRAVWPWRTPPAARADPAAPLRRKALVTALVMLVVATVVFWRLPSHRVLPLVLCGLAGLNAVLGILAPAAFGRIDAALQRFGRLCGQGLTWLLLTPFFYLVFVPARLILLARGKDPLHRRFPDTPPSYWVDRPPVKSPDEYRRQF